MSEDPGPTGVMDTRVLSELGIDGDLLASRITAEAERVAAQGTTALATAPTDTQRALVTSIKALPLSVRAANTVNAAGVQYVGEPAQLSFTDIVSIRSAGRKTAQELGRVLSDLGLQLNMRIPDWSRDKAHALQRELHSAIVGEGRQRDRALLMSFGPEPATIEQELGRIARALDTQRNADILVKLWGWAGKAPRTLESVGQELALTRERVRQIEARALKRLQKHQFETPLLRSCIALLRREAPDLNQTLADGLRDSNLSSADFSPLSVEVAAEHLRIKWPFTTFIVGSQRVTAIKEDEGRFRRAPAVLRRRTSERGCVNILALAAELHIAENRIAGLTRILEAGCKVRWLDEFARVALRF